MDASELVAEGLVTQDVHLKGDNAQVRITDDGLGLEDRHNGWRTFIETEEKPRPGDKVFARSSLAELRHSPVVERVECGGGALRMVRTYAEQARDGKRRGRVCLFNSGTESPELAAMCDQLGIQSHSFGRHNCPTNLIVDCRRDRMIIKERISSPAERLQSQQVEAVHRTVSQARTVACVSGKDGPLAAASLCLCNSARRVVQPTGSLSPEMTLLLVLAADEVVCNFKEWLQLATITGLDVPPVHEDEAFAFPTAARLLKVLRDRNLAGRDAAACTMGRCGAVVADWSKGMVYAIPLRMVDGSDGVPNRAGSGDLFLGNFLYDLETWARPLGLREPVAAAALRAMHQVAHRLGLRRDQYRLQAVPQ